MRCRSVPFGRRPTWPPWWTCSGLCGLARRGPGLSGFRGGTGGHAGEIRPAEGRVVACSGERWRAGRLRRVAAHGGFRVLRDEAALRHPGRAGLGAGRTACERRRENRARDWLPRDAPRYAALRWPARRRCIASSGSRSSRPITKPRSSAPSSCAAFWALRKRPDRNLPRHADACRPDHVFLAVSTPSPWRPWRVRSPAGSACGPRRPRPSAGS